MRANLNFTDGTSVEQQRNIMKNHSHFEDGNLTSGRHVSYWTVSAPATMSHGPLRDNIKTDVVVVGGGIAGITTAYCLVQKGMKVVLVEDGFIGSGETGRTTGHLASALDDRYSKIERLHGAEGARLAADSHLAAIDFVEGVCTREKIRCEFERLNGYLFLHSNDHRESMSKEMEAAQRAGVEVIWLDVVPGIPAEQGPCLMFPRQAQFHVMKYLTGLCNAACKKGLSCFIETHAKEIDHHGIVTGEGYRVQADHVVVATNSPVNDLVAIHTKQSAHRTYVIGMNVPKGTVQKGLWWDTGDPSRKFEALPYHYVRLQEYNGHHDLLLVGGEDHITGKPGEVPEAERYRNLEEWTRKRFPVVELDYAWSGQVLEPMDAMAFIGRNPWDHDNVYIATGDSGNGLTHGTIAGMLLSDLITETPNPWERLYDPRRFKLAAAAPTFIKDNLSVLKEYLSEALGGGEVHHVADVKRGEGRIIEIKGEKFGIYRDILDDLHAVAAACTHLNCVVRWNGDELTWDCPCHGSRFTVTGKVINGPSNRDLPYYRREIDLSQAAAGETVVHTNGEQMSERKPAESWSL